MNPFDLAIEMHELDQAAVEYALLHGEPRSPAYRRAWAMFRQQVQTIEDLKEFRAANGRTAARPKPSRPPSVGFARS
jgi:hypothetical protein